MTEAINILYRMRDDILATCQASYFPQWKYYHTNRLETLFDKIPLSILEGFIQTHTNQTKYNVVSQIEGSIDFDPKIIKEIFQNFINDTSFKKIYIVESYIIYNTTSEYFIEYWLVFIEYDNYIKPINYYRSFNRPISVSSYLKEAADMCNIFNFEREFVNLQIFDDINSKELENLFIISKKIFTLTDIQPPPTEIWTFEEINLNE